MWVELLTAMYMCCMAWAVLQI
ncbi:hypothetical protein PSEUDO9AG_41425 [Pseudomonas sp. 9Ag]|nr:hypothetical protein PSEUDO9AG_41425 [Pseudomonas sp. 9Ag]